VVSISAAVNFVAMLLFCPHCGAVGAAMATLVTECFVTISVALALSQIGSGAKRNQ